MGRIEREKTVEEALAALTARLILDARRSFGELGLDEYLDDAIQFRNETNLNPWAESSLPKKAEEIHQKYSGTSEWPLFKFAFDFIKLLKPGPQSE